MPRRTSKVKSYLIRLNPAHPYASYSRAGIAFGKVAAEFEIDENSDSGQAVLTDNNLIIEEVEEEAETEPKKEEESEKETESKASE